MFLRSDFRDLADAPHYTSLGFLDGASAGRLISFADIT
jgi:hypothetical protein